MAKVDVQWNTLFSVRRGNAVSREIEWQLTIPAFKEICQSNCFYCGAPPSPTGINGESVVMANGVDRINSTQGYVPENCVACCWICNKAKARLTVDEFISHISLLNSRLSIIKKIA